MSVYFTEDHEWIKVDGDEGIVGISPYAAKQLGEWMKRNIKLIARGFKTKAFVPRLDRGSPSIWHSLAGRSPNKSGN